MDLGSAIGGSNRKYAVKLRYLFLLWSVLTVGLLAAPAQEPIWVGLVKADNTLPTEEERLVKLQRRLKCVFGFEAYHLMHEATVASGEKYAQWVLPRKDFYLKLEPQAGSGIHYELYRDKTLLVEGRVDPKPGRPLFISGPNYLDGRLIFILQRVPAEKQP